MEFSLHRQLKSQYASVDALQEVKLGSYRIDVVVADQLIEIQHGSLAAIRDKTAQLLKEHAVLIVKPIVARKSILKHKRRGGPVVHKRWSPKRGKPIDLFDELVYLTRVFPHHNLTLEVPLVEIEESRYPGHGRRRRWRTNDFVVEDQRLLRVLETYCFRSAGDLWQLLPKRLPRPFHTGHLADRLRVQRWTAQRIAYCMRKMGAAIEVGKSGNTRLYQRKKAA